MKRRHDRRARGRVLCMGLAVAALHSAAFANEPVLQLPIEERLGTVVVPVRVNGSEPLYCILDTGMPNGLFIIDPETAARCNLEYQTQTSVGGVGAGSEMASVALSETLEFEGVAFDGQMVIVLEKPGYLAHIGVDGAVGATLFNHYVVQMDFEARTVSFFDPDTFDEREAGSSFAVTINNTKPYMETEVEIEDGERRTVSLLVDTGSNGGLSLHVTPDLQAPAKAVPTYLGAGVGGDLVGTMARVARLDLGEHQLQQVVTGFPEGANPMGDGAIGMEVLRRFLVTIDYPGERFLLRPNEAFSEPFEGNMTGIAVKPAESGWLRIHAVREGSPAAGAGIRTGDRLLTVNGRPLSFLQYIEFDDDLRVPGQKIEVVVERDGEERRVSFVTRRPL